MKDYQRQASASARSGRRGCREFWTIVVSSRTPPAPLIVQPRFGSADGQVIGSARVDASPEWKCVVSCGVQLAGEARVHRATKPARRVHHHSQIGGNRSADVELVLTAPLPQVGSVVARLCRRRHDWQQRGRSAAQRPSALRARPELDGHRSRLATQHNNVSLTGSS